jgi:hypothetical protein
MSAKAPILIGTAAPAAAPPPPPMYEIVAKAIENGQLTVAELEGIRRLCAKQVKHARHTGMIMTSLTVSRGDRVRINANYGYKSMTGVTGTVDHVQSYPGTRSPWCVVRIKPDVLPARRPRYAVDKDWLVAVAGHAVDLLPPI